VSESKQATASQYALETKQTTLVEAPVVSYRPLRPSRSHRIGLIGCGGISGAHLEAYRDAGLNVVVLCDRDASKAESRRDEFYPNAEVSTDALEVIARNDLEVLDITTHPEHRVALIERAIEASKHVLSQKPFVTDLDIGERLCQLAEARGVKLAVNQNGRWSPHLGYMREVVRAGLIGEVQSVHVNIHWDHTWTAGTPFENIEDLVLYDFGIHWFDFVSSLVGVRAHRVTATRAFAAGQTMRIPMLAQVLIELEGGQASLVFDAHQRFGARDTTYIGGSKGSLVSDGPNLGEQHLRVYTETGEAHPKLEGKWFNDGFGGAMGELLCALEQNRSPLNNARDNLRSLELCFAAIRSSRDGKAYAPGEVRHV
jgi:predicted dehydrogenase